MSSENPITSMNKKTVQSSKGFMYNVFTGSDIGYLKGIDFRTKTFHNLNSIKTLNKRFGISCMCWGQEDGSIVYAGCKGGNVIHHNVEGGTNNQLLLEYSENVDNLTEICAHDEKIVTSFTNGSVFIHKIGSDFQTFQIDHLKTFQPIDSKEQELSKNLLCMDHNKAFYNMLLTGGQENPLRVWDVNDLSADPIFIAKNPRNDWLNLRVPVWVAKAKFFPDSKKIVTGTGKGTVRLYDPTTPQRRPVIEVKCEEYPVTALAVRPNIDNQIFVGNTVGTLVAVDFRKKNIVRAYKGNKGCVTDIKCHPEYPAFAVCSTDRYVRCYEPDRSSLIHSCYVNSSLNCLLFSSHWEKKDVRGDKEENDSQINDSTSTDGENKSFDDANEDDDGEDVWKKMDVIKTKKRRVE